MLVYNIFYFYCLILPVIQLMVSYELRTDKEEKKKDKMSKKFFRKFTLIELLVVIAIIGILASLLLPSLSRARKAAMLSVSVSNLKQISIAHVAYFDGNNGRFVTSRYPSNVDYSWDDIFSELLGFDLSEDEKDSSTPPWKANFKVLQCPLDEMERNNTNNFIRTYELNGHSDANSPRMYQYGNTISMMYTEVEEPASTISMNEQSKNHNKVGTGSNVVMVGGNIDEVTTNTSLTGNVQYNPNHHDNNYRNPLLFIDGHVNITDMRTTRGNSDFLWKSKKP